MLTSALISVMIAAASKTSRIFNRDFAELQMLQKSKNPLDKFVSNTVQRLEHILIEELKRVRPTFGITTETIVENADAEQRWIVSVLDGKDNFLHAMQLFTLSIAVVSNQEIIAGLVFVPILNEIYYAEKGQGAWVELGGNLSASLTSRLRVSDRSKIDNTLIATNLQAVPNWPQNNIRNLGCNSLSLAYLAAGKVEACILKDASYCSIAAGTILVKEAGGNLSQKQDKLFASNQHFNFTD